MCLSEKMYGKQPNRTFSYSRLFLRKRLLIVLPARFPDFHIVSPSRFQWFFSKQFLDVIYSCGDSPRFARGSLFQKFGEDKIIRGALPKL